jgi:hypothetical protein
VDYPQITVKDDFAVIIYSSGIKPRITRVAKIHPLPLDDSFYIFPRLGHNPIQLKEEENKQILQFTDDFSSAGIDVEDKKTLLLSFLFNPETTGSQTILSMKKSFELFTENGELKALVSKNKQFISKINSGKWNKISIKADQNIIEVKVNDQNYIKFNTSVFPWTPYFGHASFFGVTPKKGERFKVDLKSIQSSSL